MSVMVSMVAAACSSDGRCGAAPLAPANGMTETFFGKLATLGMSEPEIALHTLRIERQALVKRAAEYHKHLIRGRSPQQLTAEYPLGYCRQELAAVNAAITNAVATVHRYRADNLQPGERLHLNVHKTNVGR